MQIIRELFGGELVSWNGEYYEVDSARMWDVPETVRCPSASRCRAKGRSSTFAPLGDHLIAVEPQKQPGPGVARRAEGDRAAGW